MILNQRIYEFYERIMKSPVLTVFPDKESTNRLIGDGTTVTLKGHSEDKIH